MRNIRLTIKYDGTNYSGWQFQKNAVSVQDVIQKALRRITGEKTNLVGSGRTDSGVHAEAQVANFKTRSKIPLKNILMALNADLPSDIAIYRVEEMPLKFDSQRSAKSKLYRYTIVNRDFMDPFLRHFAAKCFYTIDMGRMRRAARLLKGRHDFRAFQATDGADEKNSVRTIKHIKIERKNDLIYIDIEADGFLYNMARSIAGTLVEAGRGKFSLDRIREMLKSGKRSLCGPTMPAKGLSLIKVRY